MERVLTNYGRAAGLFLTVISGLALTLGAYIFTKELGTLWAFLGIALMASLIPQGVRGFSRGLVATLGCLVIGVVVYISGRPDVLWALILLMFVMDVV
jgi:hypothetical protein